LRLLLSRRRKNKEHHITIRRTEDYDRHCDHVRNIHGQTSPFCILDEIDAALDETNIHRFIHLVFDFKKNTQFIIITHNNRTIANADVMYGVTQKKRGYQKLYLQKFLKNSLKFFQGIILNYY